MTNKSPEWFACTPHAVLEYLEDGPTVRPYGVVHGRRPESGLTACGTYAVGWRIFWEITFTAGGRRACPACAAAIARAQATDDHRGFQSHGPDQRSKPTGRRSGAGGR